MAYVVDRVVICDAFREPDRHYQLLPGGRSKSVKGRRPSMRFLASAKDVKGGIAGVVGKASKPPAEEDDDPPGWKTAKELIGFIKEGPRQYLPFESETRFFCLC